MTLPSTELIFQAFEAITRRSGQLFFIYQPGSKGLEYLSPSFEALFQRSGQEVCENPEVMWELVHPDDQVVIREALGVLERNNEIKNVEFRILLPDHSEKWLCASVFPFVDEREQPFFTGLIADISNIKAYTNKLLEFNAKKNATLEILSHDLSAPFNTIQGLIGLIAKRTTSLEDMRLTEMMGMVAKTCQQGTDLIRDLVAHEFLESSNVDLSKQRVDLVAKMGELMATYQNSQKKIGKTFHFLAPLQPVYVNLDDMKFRQVLNNLISNAIKFTPDGGVITTRIEEREDQVLVAVEDNGIGIPAPLQEHIFEKFSKARRPGLKGEKSTGLGMSIIKTIVEWHGGKIGLSSQENQGTKVLIEIPKGE